MNVEIIPAINSKTFADVKGKIERVNKLTRWVHIDVADGTFTKNTLWHTPADLREYRRAHEPLPFVEAHLMINHPEKAVHDWIDAGAKRIITHVETIADFLFLKRACDNAKVFLMLSVAPNIPVTALDPYFDSVVSFQVLAVPPGFPGQLFQESSYDKIAYIRGKCRHCDLEVDGGVKPGIAKKCREAGANLFAVASGIFDNKNISDAIHELRQDIKI